ncbi:MAG: STAS domain-containing protein [Spirochaetota bacterium]
MTNMPDYTDEKYHYDTSIISIRTIAHRESFPSLPANTIIIEMVGELNLYSTPAFKDILNNVYDTGVRKILLSLQSLQYVDSSGLGVILGFQSKLSKDDGYICICSPTESVLAVLELTKLKQIMKIRNSLEEALQEL